MTQNKILGLDIVLRAGKGPDRNISPTKLVRTLEEIINRAFQDRFPGYEVEIVKLKADWPGSKENFPEFDKEKI